MTPRSLICAVLAALFIGGCSDGGTALSVGSEPTEYNSTMTVDGDHRTTTSVSENDGEWKPYALASGGLTGTRTSPEGRSLLVTFVGGAPYVEGQPCTVAYRAEVSEAADNVVEVRLSSMTPPPPTDEPFGCTLEGYSRSVEVALGAPLSDRTVIEAETRRHLEVFDGSHLASPTWMPDQWSLRVEQAGYPDPETAAYWQQTWGPDPPPPTGNTCTPTDGPISLTQGPLSGPDRNLSSLEPVSTHDVNGATATYYEGRTSAPDQVALAWELSGQSLMLDSGPTCFGEGAAPLDRLLQFARGLVVPTV